MVSSARSVVGQFGAVDDDLAFLVVSRRLMHRIMVDLPEPDGPQTTTFSFCATVEAHVAQDVHRRRTTC